MPRHLSLKTYATNSFQVRNLHGTFALSQLSLRRISPPKIIRRFVIDRPRAEETTGSQQRGKTSTGTRKMPSIRSCREWINFGPLQFVVPAANRRRKDGHLLRIGEAVHFEYGQARIDFDAPHRIVRADEPC